jgi:adenylylsulfate kinase-like enzyme
MRVDVFNDTGEWPQSKRFEGRIPTAPTITGIDSPDEPPEQPELRIPD